MINVSLRHRQYPMPMGSPLSQRVLWHVAHAKACGWLTGPADRDRRSCAGSPGSRRSGALLPPGRGGPPIRPPSEARSRRDLAVPAMMLTAAALAPTDPRNCPLMLAPRFGSSFAKSRRARRTRSFDTIVRRAGNNTVSSRASSGGVHPASDEFYDAPRPREPDRNGCAMARVPLSQIDNLRRVS